MLVDFPFHLQTIRRLLFALEGYNQRVDDSEAGERIVVSAMLCAAGGYQVPWHLLR